MKTKSDSDLCCSCDNIIPIWHVRLYGYSDIGKGDISLVRGISHMCGHAHVRSHVSPGMDRA